MVSERVWEMISATCSAAGTARDTTAVVLHGIPLQWYCTGYHCSGTARDTTEGLIEWSYHMGLPQETSNTAS